MGDRHLQMVVELFGQETGAPSFKSGIDPAEGLVCISCGGFWDRDFVEKYFAAQNRINAEARRKFGALKVLFDLTTASPQAPPVMESLRLGNMTLYAPDDRIALVNQSAIIALQLKRLFQVGKVETFRDLASGQAWLTA